MFLVSSMEVMGFSMSWMFCQVTVTSLSLAHAAICSSKCVKFTEGVIRISIAVKAHQPKCVGGVPNKRTCHSLGWNDICLPWFIVSRKHSCLYHIDIHCCDITKVCSFHSQVCQLFVPEFRKVWKEFHQLGCRCWCQQLWSMSCRSCRFSL